jgi:hypothetical protein
VISNWKQECQNGFEAYGADMAHIHSIVIDELLREIVDHTFDAAAQTLGTTCLPRLEFTSDLMALAIRT